MIAQRALHERADTDRATGKAFPCVESGIMPFESTASMLHLRLRGAGLQHARARSAAGYQSVTMAQACRDSAAMSPRAVAASPARRTGSRTPAPRASAARVSAMP